MREPIRSSLARSLLLTALVAACAGPVRAGDYPLGGASKPEPRQQLKPRVQYKRVHQLALRFLLSERFTDAERLLADFAAQQPDDAETQFLWAALHARRGESKSAVAALSRALARGLPVGRIAAAERDLFAALKEDVNYQQLTKKLSDELVHGPLLGDLTDRGASFWVRTARECEVQAVVTAVDIEHAPILSAPVRTTKARDYTAVVRVEGLTPGAEYQYALKMEDHPPIAGERQRFRTMPPAGSPAQFTIAFGGGAGFVPAHERVWDTISSFNPAALLLLGDNVYIDDPESPIMQRYTYHRRQSRPEWRRLTAQTPVFAIWDDHDFGTNDCWGGPRAKIPYWKIDHAWPIFQQNWSNPAYGGGSDSPGCYYRFRIADVDFLMLDCRYWRTDPESPAPSMLGPTQLAWLKDQLRQCTGTFKVLCSSVPWDFRTKNDSLDTWNGYRSERAEIFRWLEQLNIDGVVLMSADRHRSDAWRIERSASYALYEFNSSRLTNEHVHPTMEKQGALLSYNAKQSFGLVHFDTTAADPQVTYEVVTIDGEKVHSLVVGRGE